MRVMDGRAQFEVSFAEWVAANVADQARKMGVVIDEALDPRVPIAAQVNQNRWIAQCPDCFGATYVWKDDLRQFCPSCLNAVAGHRYRRVVMPAEDEVSAIEAMLEHRPLPHNRNWSPGETVEGLAAENLERGLPATLEVMGGDDQGTVGK